MTFKTAPRLDIWRKELIWAWNQALWDAPSKVLAHDEPDPQLLLTQQLAPDLNNVHHELILVSAYFVPGQPGLVYLTGRASDMYISGGSNIYPREIEEYILLHGAITEVAVVGVPDRQWGEVGVAVVVASAMTGRCRSSRRTSRPTASTTSSACRRTSCSRSPTS